MSLLTGFNISVDEVGLLEQASLAAFAGENIPAGWNVVTPAQLGLASQYSDGIYFTDPASRASAIVLQQGSNYIVSFRGTDDQTDVEHYIELGTGTYIHHYDALLNALIANAPSDAGFAFTGASLGGAATNLMADISGSAFGGRFAAATFVAVASPIIKTAAGILNLGFENDPIYKGVNGYADSPSSLDHLVLATDRYMAGNYDGHQPLDAYAHSSFFGFEALGRFGQSAFLDSMTPDSVLIFDANAGLVQDITPGRESTGVFYLGENVADSIAGRSGNDFIEGFGGNDTLNGGAGDDTIDGGAGTDTAIFSSNYSAYTLTKLGNGSLRVAGPDGTDTLTNIESLQFSDQTVQWSGVVNGGNDIYYVDNAGDQVLESINGGNDRVYASVSYTLGAGQEIETLVTRVPAATTAINLTGNEFANTIVGNAGANTIDGKGGADLMYGQGGDDILYVDNAADRVLESAGGGNDRVYTSVSYTLAAGQEIETFLTTLPAATTAINLTGNEFAQTIVGNAGANIIDGKGGIDMMYGQGGDDFYYVDNASDRVFESAGSGNDRVYASASYALAAGQEIETFVTKLSTATTAIDLTGNEFAQTIVGNAGANTIDGKGGNDLLYGSGGNDRFVFDTALNASTNVDRIADFTASTGAAGNIDKIALDDSIFVALNPTHAAKPFTLSEAAFTTAAPANASQHIIYNATSGALSYDDDGNGAHAAMQFATVSAHLALTNADFLVV